ncbi:hypothetical protein ACFQL4_15245 [Halosimplex aquaticum]
MEYLQPAVRRSELRRRGGAVERGRRRGAGVGAVRLDLWLLVAKGTGVAVGMVVNYVFESLFTWQVHEE